ncbi:hypothetical protein [Bradyrhizobium sp. 6(2017)]|uniref:hypothetical protein n=1 Tax=Bradyrhizobium sp. 6(2017) TaxID=1197460 RepID=UPI0013E106E1|nr:hypothetical protein [Bradyrhizobium sp. 6(2017)]QIG93781.1 hypothetical protein G6P99_15610 [Bradyrhizobium sp. 6(2017)]
MARHYNEQFRQLWIDAGYSKHAGSAAVVPPPPIEYRRVYYLTSAEYGLSNIVFGRIKVSRLSTLNDPFEVLCHGALGHVVKRQLLDLKDRLDATLGLICFSTDWTDPALWAHYGDRNRGICLGVDIPRGMLRQIDYMTDRLQGKINSAHLASPSEALIDQLLTTKFSSWKYEDEFRRIVALSDAKQEGHLHFLDFDKNLRLAQVIVGQTCHLNWEKVKETTKKMYPSADVCKAQRSRRLPEDG